MVIDTFTILEDSRARSPKVFKKLKITDFETNLNYSLGIQNNYTKFGKPVLPASFAIIAMSITLNRLSSNLNLPRKYSFEGLFFKKWDNQ